MRYKTKCDCCGQQLTAYTHNLNKPMVGALRQLVDYYERTKKPANLQKNLRLTKNQYNNFQKLQYFDLAKRITKGWFPTTAGIDFVYGQSQIVTPVATLGKVILHPNHKAWDTHSRGRKVLMVYDIDQTQYKKRDEYQREKSNQPSML